MNLQIQLAAVASQRLSVSVGGQNFRINVYQLDADLYFDLFLGDTPIATTRVARNNLRMLLPSRYLGVRGDFVFVDTRGDEPPHYTGLGVRWFLLYVPEEDLQL